MTAGLITAIVGGGVCVLAFLLDKAYKETSSPVLIDLFKYAFAVGLLAWLFGH